MNELITLEGLCIKSVGYGETDAIINIYAAGRGKISAKVRVARGAKGKLRYAASLLTFAKYVLSVKGDKASVTACDVSQPALDSVMKNVRLNGLDNVNTVCGDAFAILRDFRRSGKKFDLVILDPPAFCKTADEVKDAYRGYKDINIQGMKLVKSGGFLITCSCSHYMTSTLFERMLTEAASEKRCVSA